MADCTGQPFLKLSINFLTMADHGQTWTDFSGHDQTCSSELRTIADHGQPCLSMADNGVHGDNG